jgi:hypothetical protein
VLYGPSQQACVAVRVRLHRDVGDLPASPVDQTGERVGVRVHADDGFDRFCEMGIAFSP